MRYLSLILLTILCSLTIRAQQVQWAGDVKRFSTEFGRNRYGAKQVLGAPNKIPAFGESAVAWAPAEMDNPRGEFIHVSFEKPMRINRVLVGQSFNPGAVSKVTIFFTNGGKEVVFEKEIEPAVNNGYLMQNFTFPLTASEVDEVRIDLQTRPIAGMNQIDCIGIANSEEKIDVVIREPFIADTLSMKEENLGPAVNSSADDMLPLVSPDGTVLYFARKRHPENVGEFKRDDIWYSERQPDGSWGPAQHMDAPLNNEHHNYVAWVSPDGNALALANDYKNPGIGQRVSMSERDGNIWSFPKTLPVNDMYNRNEFSCYHMNTEGNILLLAIERGDSYGDMDIYVSFKRPNGAWTRPQNIGPTVNSAATEGSVFLAADNRTIYFASNGHSGYGGFDMFMSRRLDDTWTNWSEPLNMGQWINSSYDDFYYTIPASGDYIYYSSRNNSYGGADLFRIPLPPELQPAPIALLKTKLIDVETGEPVMAEISYGGLIAEEPIASTITTGKDIQLIIPENNYDITIKTPGYIPVYKQVDIVDELLLEDFDEADPIQVARFELRNKTVPALREQKLDRETIQEELKQAFDSLESTLTQPDEEMIVEELTDEILKDSIVPYKEVNDSIYMIPIREGQVLTLDAVFFDANKSRIRDESYAQLDEMAGFLLDNPNIVVEIGGHTNGLPEHEFCNRLSSDRAEKVALYFYEKGVPRDRVSWKGYGKTEPIADNATLAGRKKNQRVELKIIEIRE